MATTVPFVGSVFHPSDFGEGSERAFAHALAIALMRQTRFMLFHSSGILREDWHEFPQVRRTLERWGLLAEGSERSAVLEELSVRVTKVRAKGDPARACLEEIAREQPDLVVMATEGRDGLARWLRPSIAARIARRSSTMSLFVPSEGRGFVDPDTGRLTLHRILVPVDESPNPRAALVRASRAAEAFGDPPVSIRVLRVNGDPKIDTPVEGSGWRLEPVRADGDVVEAILADAEEADLVVMPTDGRDGVLDVFRGSHTERVISRASCPVLAVPSL